MHRSVVPYLFDFSSYTLDLLFMYLCVRHLRDQTSGHATYKIFLFSFSHINIMSRKLTIKHNYIYLSFSLIYFKQFRNLSCMNGEEKCSKKEGIGRMKTNYYCLRGKGVLWRLFLWNSRWPRIKISSDKKMYYVIVRRINLHYCSRLDSFDCVS